jgi:hypothetical protein
MLTSPPYIVNIYQHEGYKYNNKTQHLSRSKREFTTTILPPSLRGALAQQKRRGNLTK